MSNLPAVIETNWNLPNVRGQPVVPRVGEVAGQATTYVGEQLGNAPDLMALPVIASLKKKLLEQIKSLIDGQLPTALRAPKYAAQAADLAEFVSELQSRTSQLINQVTGEINGQIGFITEQIAGVNQAKAAILTIPVAMRTETEMLTIQRLGSYLAELSLQRGRLQSTLSTVASQDFVTEIETEILERATDPVETDYEQILDGGYF